MSRSWDTNEFGSMSCWGNGPYILTALGIPDAERTASGWTPMRSYADRWIQRVSPVASSDVISSGSMVSMPSRSQPDNEKTPGCSALNITNRRCACLISVSYTHLRAHETRHDLVCRLLLE